MSELTYKHYDFFERARSRRSFVASVFFGIVAGGIINLLSPYFSESLSQIEGGFYIPWILLAGAIVLVFVALEFSTRSEGIPLVFKVTVVPENVTSICKTLLSELEHDTSDEAKPVRTSVMDLQRFLEDKERLRVSGLSELTQYMSRIPTAAGVASSIVVNSLLCKLAEYLKFIEQLTDHLTSKTQEACVGYFKDFTVAKHSRGCTVRSKSLTRMRRPVLNIDIEANTEDNLLTPSFLVVTMFPQKFQELVAKQNSIGRLLNRLRLYPEFLQLGVSFVGADEAPLLEQIEDIKHRVESSTQRIIDEFQITQQNLQRTTEIPTEPEKEQKKRARSS